MRHHENDCCEAYLRYCESLMGALASEVDRPENNSSVAPNERIDLSFKIGPVQIACEHTRIESRVGEIQMQNKLKELFSFLQEEFHANDEDFFDVLVPNQWANVKKRHRLDRNSNLIRLLREKLTWMRTVASKANGPVEVGTIDGHKLYVACRDFAMGGPWVSPYETDVPFNAIEERIKVALRAKLPKLSAWKLRSFKTVLILSSENLFGLGWPDVLGALRNSFQGMTCLPDDCVFIQPGAEYIHIYPFFTKGNFAATDNNGYVKRHLIPRTNLR